MWRTSVNMVINLKFIKLWEYFHKQTILAFSRRICFLDLEIQ
jgi:hypothetical protein